MSNNGEIAKADALRLQPSSPKKSEAAEALARFECLLSGCQEGDHASFPGPGGSEMELFGRHYRELFDFFTEGCLITDLRGIILEANQAAASLLRTRKEFLIDKPLPLFVARRRSDFYALLVRLSKEASTVHDCHTVIQPLRGEAIEVLMWVARVEAGGGRMGVLRWLVRDITSLLAAERALRAERDFAKSVLDNAQAVVLVLEDYRIVRTNLYLRGVSGYEENDLLGKDWKMLLPEEDHASAQKMVYEALSQAQCKRWTTGLRTRDGSRRCVEWSAKAFIQAEAPESGSQVLLLGHDITELQEAQQQALQAERLAAVGQVMARLAHESRNLLQRSQACLERLNWRMQDRPEALELLKRMQRTHHDLAHLLDDVRGYSAPMRLEREPCDLRRLLHEAWEDVRAVFPDKEAVLVEEGEANPLCQADGFRVLQVFRNLLDNAFSVCSAPIRIRASWTEAKIDGKPGLEVRLHDNGPGFGPEQRKRLFEPFFTTKQYGSGLGMAISQRVVQAHGGRIAVGESGQPGAEIIIQLPRDGP